MPATVDVTAKDIIIPDCHFSVSIHSIIEASPSVPFVTEAFSNAIFSCSPFLARLEYVMDEQARIRFIVTIRSMFKLRYYLALNKRCGRDCDAVTNYFDLICHRRLHASTASRYSEQICMYSSVA